MFFEERKLATLFGDLVSKTRESDHTKETAATDKILPFGLTIKFIC